MPEPSSLNRPLLLLAPHLEWPALNGADLTHDALAAALSVRLPYVVVVGMREVVRYEKGAAISRIPFPNTLRSRQGAALRTLVRGSHYFAERFNTPPFVRVASDHLADACYGTILYSYLTTASLAVLPHAGDITSERRHLVWTHNNEPSWFQDQARSTRNPLARLIAIVSGGWIRRFAARHAHVLTLLHVTEADYAGWREHVPQHHGAVIPIGAKLPATVAPPLSAGASLRLLFVGALGVKMNLDALEHFAQRYFPTLLARFGSDLRVDVVGSSPLPAVDELCQAHGWTLHPNAPDVELEALLSHATATLLPFAYATGAKLKLLTSLASGVPFVGTEAVHAQAELAAPPSLLSNDPEAWAEHLAHLQAMGLDAAARTRLRSLAEEHSWDASAQRLLALL